MSRTLYISDLDGTLLSDAAKIKPRTADMLNDFIGSGVLFSYCTARSLSTAGRICADISFEIPVILMNGVFIYDTRKKEYIAKNTFGEEQAALLRETVIRLGETPMIDAFIGGEMKNSFIEGSKNLGFYMKDRKKDPRMRPLGSYERMFDGEIFYAAFVDPVHTDELDRIFTPENGFRHTHYADSYDRSRIWYEVFSAKAGKASAVLTLKNIVERRTGEEIETVCFGDNSNDLPMFAVCDRKYAVGNAIPEVKAAADAVIGTNEGYGVPEFIEKETFPVFERKSRDAEPETPDPARFTAAVRKALERERGGIGTLNEKTIHNTLKHYYCDEDCHEIKIGGFFADAVGEDGIFEIQTADFSKLRRKLSGMLRAAHVTVVYPFEKKTRVLSINSKTGEVLSESKRTSASLSKLFLELYRIKGFLTNPNLTLRIAFLETQKKIYYADERKLRRRGLKKEKLPLALLSETIIDKPSDLAQFLPPGLPDTFTRAELQKLCPSTDASLMLSVMEMTGNVMRAGKRGREILYKVCLVNGE